MGRGRWDVRLIPVDLFVQLVVDFLVPLLLIALHPSISIGRCQIDQLDLRCIPRHYHHPLHLRDLRPDRLLEPPDFLMVELQLGEEGLIFQVSEATPVVIQSVKERLVPFHGSYTLFKLY